jgi:hypothetical protein
MKAHPTNDYLEEKARPNAPGRQRSFAAARRVARSWMGSPLSLLRELLHTVDTGERTGTGEGRATGDDAVAVDAPADAAPRSSSRRMHKPVIDCLALDAEWLFAENFLTDDFRFLLMGLATMGVE